MGTDIGDKENGAILRKCLLTGGSKRLRAVEIWIPAFAGMTKTLVILYVTPAKAGVQKQKIEFLNNLLIRDADGYVY